MAARLPLPIPAPVRIGRPGSGYPWSWSVCPWLEGATAADEPPRHPFVTARQLGAFLAALHAPAPPDAPANPYRGVPLPDRAQATQDRIEQMSEAIDAPAVHRCWNELAATPGWTGPPLWLHGDLHPLNVLVHEGRLSGVIDFGDVTAGDPATDLSVAWMLFDPSARARVPGRRRGRRRRHLATGPRMGRLAGARLPRGLRGQPDARPHRPRDPHGCPGGPLANVHRTRVQPLPEPSPSVGAARTRARRSCAPRVGSRTFQESCGMKTETATNGQVCRPDAGRAWYAAHRADVLAGSPSRRPAGGASNARPRSWSSRSTRIRPRWRAPESGRAQGSRRALRETAPTSRLQSASTLASARAARRGDQIRTSVIMRTSAGRRAGRPTGRPRCADRCRR